MVAKSFEPDDMLNLGFDRITTSLYKLHKHLGILVGNATAQTEVPLAADTTQEADKSQLTVEDIEIYPSTHVVTWDPRSMEDLSREFRSSSAHSAAGMSSQGSSTPSHASRMLL